MLEPHIERARAINRDKRDAALAALNEHCVPWVSFRVPNGGIYFWLETLARASNGIEVSDGMEAEGVACRPGERFTGDHQRTPVPAHGLLARARRRARVTASKPWDGP